MVLAADEPGISAIRSAVPEFEDALRAEFASEAGQLGSFQAMSCFARWIAAHVAEHGADDVAQRGLAAIEDLITDETIQLGDALAAEFIENTWDDPALVALMGPRTQERAEPSR
jgi:hypothetical protein